MREKEKAAQKKQQRLSDAIRAEDKKKEDALYRAFYKALKPYHNEKIDGYKTTIKATPKDHKVDFYVDGYHWLTFRPEWHHYSACDSDGYPTGEGSSWMTLSVVQHKTRCDYYCWFSCDEEDLADADKFATAMGKMMNEFEYKDF